MTGAGVMARGNTGLNIRSGIVMGGWGNSLAGKVGTMVMVVGSAVIPSGPAPAGLLGPHSWDNSVTTKTKTIPSKVKIQNPMGILNEAMMWMGVGVVPGLLYIIPIHDVGDRAWAPEVMSPSVSIGSIGGGVGVLW